MADPAALVAFAVEATIGWPAWLYAWVGHPVGGIARLIGACERRWNRSGLPRRFLGVVTMAIVVGAVVTMAVVAERAVRALGLGWVGVAVLAWPALAHRSLYDHVRPVALVLERGDLPAARRAVGMIVGRDTEALDEAGLLRAAIESLAESFCDGVVAPFLFLVVGGLPGVWAYKAINTADSLIGHREERWRLFGWAAARIDDVANLVPARLAGVLICLSAGRGWRIMWRDARRHASPNAGWTEAAMAGALDLTLAGPVSYDGILSDKPFIGGGGAVPQPPHLRHAIRLYIRACGMLWCLGGVVLWLR